MRMLCAILSLALMAAAMPRGEAGQRPPSQPAPQPAAHPAWMASLPVEILSRLELLHPDEPSAYFELAEEVADIADDPGRLGLAQSLYAMAFELDRRRITGAAGRSLAASAALGLADIQILERDRRWLIAIAGTMDERYLLPDWTIAAWPSVSDDVAFKAATAIGLARAGEGREARRMLDQPGVRELLQRFERALGATGGGGALFRVERYADQWPCRECGNARAVTRPGPRGPEVRLCPTCEGNPGPRLTEEEFIAQLRFESALLRGIQQSWGAQVMVDAGSPLLDPDPDELAATFGVDASRPYWRHGRWVAAP